MTKTSSAKLTVHPTRIPEVLIVEPEIHSDERGFFTEIFRDSRFVEAGIGPRFVQTNQSGSKRGVLRGLHYQIRQAQGKLVRVVNGEIFDVAVDMRKQSAHFGDWVGSRIRAEDHQMVWVPPGFAHGFLVLSEWTEVLYMATDYYAPEHERTLIWNDQVVGIDWPLIDGQAPILSEKDAAGIKLHDAETYS